MGSKKGDRSFNRQQKNLKRRNKSQSGFDDGGGWKRPRMQGKPKRRQNEQAIQRSIEEYNSLDEE